ncbi:hypothetical protein [Candidatus Amarolinea dominans]|uniref:hypothetical protein n=1 Tax=Candidatus Amarolinea dominans TaxID=3140696 RepID=UPI0031CC6D41
MSNLGLMLLYDIVNRQPDMLAERAYAPWVDMEALMRQEGMPLFSLETRHPLRDFDIIGFGLPYEQLFTNTLNCLDLAGIPLRTAQRTADDPLILAGGSAGHQPGADVAVHRRVSDRRGRRGHCGDPGRARGLEIEAPG